MPNLEHWRTAVTSVADGSIRYRGTSVVELMEHASIEQVVWLLLVGTPADADRLDAVRRALVAAADHGIAAPSIATARVCASTGGAPGVAIAAGLLAFAGPAHGGAAEAVSALLVALATEGAPPVADEVARARAEKRRVPGFGHPVHTADPRVPGLLGAPLAERRHRDLALELEAAVTSQISPRLRMNADVAVAALLLDAGLRPAEINLLTSLGRTIGLAAHVAEERREEAPFRTPSLSTIEYVGPTPEEDR